MELPERRRVGASRGRRPCPPHGPHVVDVAGGGTYVARCLKCGLVGSEHKDVLGAKLAFDARWV